MAAERITPEAVVAARDVLDGEAKVVAGDLVVSIGFTNAAVKSLLPREWEDLAAYLLALIAREPVKSSPAFVAHRILLGALATELRGFAAAAGEPVGLVADLRGTTSKAEERRIRERLADQAAAFDRHIEEVLIANAVQSEIDLSRAQEEPPDEPPAAAPPDEIDDVLAAL